MRRRSVLVAGATGRLGREITRELNAHGHRVRALARNAARLQTLEGLADDLFPAEALDPTTLHGAFTGIDSVISCLGASVIPTGRGGRRTFTELDLPANRHLITAARETKIDRFVYVSVFGAERLPHLDFVRGHEETVQFLRESGLPYRIIRPTGFFSSMAEILLTASHGLLPEFRQGTARTNPIHEADLATFCVAALEDETEGSDERDVGGPEILTRRQIAALAWQSAGKKKIALPVPVGTLRLGGRLLRPFHPRAGHLLTFIAEILKEDFVAPSSGSRTMTAYFAERAKS